MSLGNSLGCCFFSIIGENDSISLASSEISSLFTASVESSKLHMYEPERIGAASLASGLALVRWCMFGGTLVTTNQSVV